MAMSGSDLMTLAEVRDNNFVVDNNTLFGLMKNLEKQIGTRPMVIVSIAGAFRSGKSFIMNFFLRYLRNKGWENREWFGDAGSGLIGEFPWKRGTDACTKGINVWREVFNVPIADGRQAAVILVDTQGLFDGDASPDINAKLMSLSTLFCSHQILNLRHQIEERDLEHLQLCIAYAQAVGSIGKRDEAKPFQKLTFLVRDWEHDNKYGDSTKGYLRKYFGRKSKSPEVQKVKDSISLAFHSYGCTLLPHPGNKVAKPEDKHVLTNQDMEEDFKEYVIEFMDRVLHPNNLVIKRGNGGKEQTMQELGNMLATVGHAFRAGKLPTAQTLLQSVVKGSNTSALINAVAEYKKHMGEVCRNLLDPQTLETRHHESLKKAIEHFHTLAKMGDEESKIEFLEKLKMEIDEGFQPFKMKNKYRKAELNHKFQKIISECENTYSDKMKQISPEVDSKIFESLHLHYEQELMSKFRSATKKFIKAMPEIEDLERELKKSIDLRHQFSNMAWETKKQKMQAKSREALTESMYNILHQFREQAGQYEGNDPNNAELNLTMLKANCLSWFDQEVAGNSEKTAIRTYKKALESDMAEIIKRVIYSNELARANSFSFTVLQANSFNFTVSQFQQSMRECLSRYKSSMKTVASTQLEVCHDQNKKEALRSFDSKVKGFENMPQVVNMKMELEDNIDNVLKEIQMNNEKEERQMKENAVNSMDKFVDEFTEEAVKYRSKYEKDLENVLQLAKQRCMQNYDIEMASNNLKDTPALERKLNGITRNALLTNNTNYDRLKEGFEILGRKYAGELEKNLDKLMGEAYLMESVFDQYKDHFLRENVWNNKKYKDLPGWGKEIVDDCIANMVQDLKRRNEAHKEHRSVNVSPSEKVVNFFKAVGKGAIWLWDKIVE